MRFYYAKIKKKHIFFDVNTVMCSDGRAGCIRHFNVFKIFFSMQDFLQHEMNIHNILLCIFSMLCISTAYTTYCCVCCRKTNVWLWPYLWKLASNSVS